jgi:hypothetical protein
MHQVQQGSPLVLVEETTLLAHRKVVKNDVNLIKYGQVILARIF